MADTAQYVGIAGKIAPAGYKPSSFEEILGNGLLIKDDQIQIDQDLLSGKVDVEEGKGLSSNDFTDDLKTKLENIEELTGKVELNPATNTTLGGVIIGAGLSITEDGVVSVSANPDTGEIAGTVQWQNVIDKPNFFASGENYLDYTLLNNTPTADTYAGIGLEVAEQKISLKSEYINYLEAQLYKKPTISFTLTSFPSGTFEVGKSFTGTYMVSINTTNHNNISPKTVSLTGHNGSIVTEIPLPDATVSSSQVFSITSSSETTKTVRTTITDVKGESISATRSFTTIFPIFTGLWGEEISGDEVYNSLTKHMFNTPKSISNVSVTPAFEDKKWMWICVPSNKSVNDVTANGFASPMNNPVSVVVTNQSGISTNYNCYRTYSGLALDVNFKFTVVS